MIKSAVVGVGYLGRYHAEKYARLKTAELTAVVDLTSDPAAKLARKFRAKYLTDYRELPKLGVQCASVASTTSTHFEIASWLLENGIDVLVEKPMTTTTEEARKLIDIAEANGRILQAGHLERFNPAFRAMRDVLKQPRFFEVRRIAPFTGRGCDVDVILDLMIHDIDIVRHLVGRPLLKIESLGVPVITESFDIVNARLTFEGGAVANVTASRAAISSERTIRIFQPDLYISLDFGKRKLKIYTLDEPFDGVGFPKVRVVERRVEERDALEDEIGSFVQCVATREQPEATGLDGLRALETVEQIHKAIRESMSLIDAPEAEQILSSACKAKES